ncbi:hypothetical protein [Traorella massiliensis]|uniref:hypothetical protein n=1 Tax=Traorella massiliensis TaxID=1903263 RepID=UPI0008F8E215|nr:hypothetical protein [Traorella massiliensis]
MNNNGEFFDWLVNYILQTPQVLVVIVTILAVLIIVLLIFVMVILPGIISFNLYNRRQKKQEQYQNDIYTAKTIGVIRSMKQTGRYINENPEFCFVLDALTKDGTFFQTTVTENIPLIQISMLAPGEVISIRYDPENCSHAIGDNAPDIALIDELIARYQCQRHPEELSYDQRMELARNSVIKKALLESFRLTGKKEAGDQEAEVIVRITDNIAGDSVMSRTLYVNDKMLQYMIPGKYIDISIIPGKDSLFGIVTDITTKVVS